MNRGFEDAREIWNEMLAEAMAKQLKPVYCSRCGSRLRVRSVQHEGFDKDTGYPTYDVTLGCPHATLYETDISREVRFAWRNPFDRHTVHKVSKVIELNSDIADAYYKRGDAYDEMDEYEKAIADYNVAIKLNPNHALAYFSRGYAYDEMGEYGKEIADYNKAIELDPNHALAYHNRGCAYHKMGEYVKAIADYNKAIELDSSDADTYYSRGLAYQEKGEVPKAVSDLEKCIGLSTNPKLMVAAQQALNKIKNSP